jgi:hypothetical protein
MWLRRAKPGSADLDHFAAACLSQGTGGLVGLVIGLVVGIVNF